MKKAILLLAAAIAAFPVGHLAYDRLHVPDVDTASAEWRLRLDALARARVFLPDAPPLAGLDLTRNPGDPLPFAPDADIECRYQPKDTSGTTPKFDCLMASGEEVKVKYGINPEIPGEVAATRLLSALGFGADRMSIVRRVRCYGCPRSPYRSRQAAEWFFVAGILDRFLDYTEYADFAYAAVERKLDARAFEIGESEGWAWFELPAVDPARGGASRAEVDALRLMAVFLAHWDNKSSNQRIVCLGDRREDGPAPCDTPLLMIQDAGATFGPRKVDYAGWSQSPIWADGQGCTVSMAHMPYGGATFETVRISEEGRRLLASKIGMLTRDQITALFRSSNFPDAGTGRVGATNVGPWVDAFQQKVAAITNRLCEPSPSR